MIFNKTSGYSLNVLSFMARDPGRRMSASYINRELGIPYSYLRNIMSSLSKKGFVLATRGRSGGFMLGRDIDNIFLSEIIDATEGLGDFSKCVMGLDECPFNQGCTMHPLWVELRSNFLTVLESTSLADLLKSTMNK